MIDIIEEILKPKIIGKIDSMKNCGNWTGTDCTRDIHEYILNAMQFLPAGERLSQLLMNRKTNACLYQFDSQNHRIYEDVVKLFGAKNIEEVLILKDIVIRLSDDVPDGIALVISDNNSIVIIHTD